MTPPNLRKASGQFLRDMAPWQWWATLTFRDYVYEEKGKAALRWWLRMVARHVARDHVKFAWATDYQGRETLHFHVLLSWRWDSLVFNEELGTTIWRASPLMTGLCRVRRYDGSGGAAEYEAAHDEWDVGVACPRFANCRRRRCRCAPGQW
jgi:hypothetical protein